MQTQTPPNLAPVILARIAKYTDHLQRGQKIDGTGPIPEGGIARLEASTQFDIEEFVKFQELKSSAWLGGKFSTETAQLIYNYLGETPAHANRQPLAVRLVLTQVLTELLSMSLRERGVYAPTLVPAGRPAPRRPRRQNPVKFSGPRNAC
jgi:hypothetical protein